MYREANGVAPARALWAASLVAVVALGGSTASDARPSHRDPPDVDIPPGLQDVLASDPKRGFRSHSEISIAQSPLDSNLLVAASKFFNRDPNSLRHYKFKVGSYVSFDGGRSWRDLGQTRTCKLSRAPPSSWPTSRCYPRDLPDRHAPPLGAGLENGDPDAKIAGLGPRLRRAARAGALDEGRPGASLQAKRGLADVGEQYITSDPWVDFDDEGNAYLMVLDAPPFENGLGAGMSFHRWATPTRGDVRHDRTWSKKVVIDAYETGRSRRMFKDDKNTFAVNNSGPDRDGEIGPIVACWTRANVPADRGRIVCKRSTDGGRHWPGAPVAVSPGDPALVIGAFVIGDSRDEDRFYTMWLKFSVGRSGNFEDTEFWLSRSTDGGRSWSAASLVTPLNGVPLLLPGADFRNASLPMLAAGPAEGELYATYAEYRPASAADSDGMQADVMLIHSTDGGASWSAPTLVNGDRTDADQFQPTVAVTPSGQVNVSYFDRRGDPANLFIDAYLSRSNDGGRTFADTRVSHDMWDPEQRPPLSLSGSFIGDYQGLVADDCRAIPLVNDTHLANSKRRDRDFDRGEPRSRFQEAISWRVPNEARFGGPVRGPNC